MSLISWRLMNKYGIHYSINVMLRCFSMVGKKLLFKVLDNYKSIGYLKMISRQPDITMEKLKTESYITDIFFPKQLESFKFKSRILLGLDTSILLGESSLGRTAASQDGFS